MVVLQVRRSERRGNQMQNFVEHFLGYARSAFMVAEGLFISQRGWILFHFAFGRDVSSCGIKKIRGI